MYDFPGQVSKNSLNATELKNEWGGLEMYLFIATREATPVEVLTPSSLVKKRDERAPKQLSSSWL
jgi:hypothetical protein